MVDTNKFLNLLIKNKINFFSGVPDSCTSQLCNLLNSNKKIKNFVAPNEGHAVSLGIGYHLSSGRIPCVYLQNSGLGNAIDPITNLISKDIYNLPLLMIIGWRGRPGLKDEPQHNIQGKILLKTLKSCEIDYQVLNREKDFIKINNLIKKIKTKSLRGAIIVDKNTFTKTTKKKQREHSSLERQDIIKFLLEKINKKTKIISSVGYNSRELHQIRKEKFFKNGKDFLVVGGMGHTLSIALSYTLNKNEPTICLDGDGSFLMHLGSFVLLNKIKRKNFKYIMINNNSHESVGDQKINVSFQNYEKLAKYLGFKNYYFIDNKKNLNLINKFLKSNGPSFLHAKIKIGTLKNLVRPSNFTKIKDNFMN